MIKAVIFDIDGVLLDSFEANLRFYQDLMPEAGYRAPTREEFLHLFHLTMMDVIKVLTKSESDDEIKRIWELGKSDQIKYRLDLLSMPGSTEDVIKLLSENYLLGIVTSRIQESVFEAPGLAALKEYFRAVVSYQDTEKHKPDPEPLLLAAKRLNVQPNESVYIGDVENDVIAGKAAGMKVIIYSKDKFNNADRCISDFSKLPEVIGDIA